MVICADYFSLFLRLSRISSDSEFQIKAQSFSIAVSIATRMKLTCLLLVALCSRQVLDVAAVPVENKLDNRLQISIYSKLCTIEAIHFAVVLQITILSLSSSSSLETELAT